MSPEFYEDTDEEEIGAMLEEMDIEFYRNRKWNFHMNLFTEGNVHRKV